MTANSYEASLSNLTVTQFLDALAAATPTPGGGSAAALAGATAAALVGMVARISLAKTTDASRSDRLAEIERKAASLQATLTKLIERDAAAYTQVLAAYRLPKVSEDEKATRSAAIQAAFKQATQAPLETAAACTEVLGLAGEVAELGIPSAASDSAVAALLAHAGLRGAALNVAVNLENIKDSEFIRHADGRLAGLLQSRSQRPPMGAPALDEALAPLGREG